MKKVIVIFLFISVTTVSVSAQSKSYAAEMAKTVMTMWKDSFGMQAGKVVRWSYDQSVVLKGIHGLWLATGDVTYFNYIQRMMDFYVNDKGVIRTYEAEDYNIDNIASGRLLLLLYNVTGREKYLMAVRTLRNQLKTHPRTKEGGFWHKKIYPHQMWLDGLYMGQPFYTEYSATFGEDNYNDIAHQFIVMEKRSRDNKTGLLYHGYDESREQQWANKITGLSPHIWGRAMGWYGSALVDVLEVFPKDHPKRDSLTGILKRLATAIAKYQDKSTGLWYDIIDLPKKEKNYVEASASSQFVYTLLKGARLGVLSQSFVPVAKKGYDGILKTFVKVENGQTNLHGTVSVSGLGGKPYRDGSFEYYMSEKVVVNDLKGVGAYIMASNEIELLPTLQLGKGKTVVLDNYFNHEIKKNADGKDITWHYTWDEMANGGYSLFGFVFNKHGVQTKTLTAAPTAQNLKGADIYLIVDPDTEKETKNPNYIQPNHINTIYDWVKGGGVLLLFGNDTGNVEMTHFNQLAKKLGFQFNYDSRNRVQGNRYEMGEFKIPEGHPIFKTAKKIHIKEYASQSVATAIPVFKDGETVVMSIAKIGKGTVFAVADPWFYNEYLDGRKLPAAYENYKAAEDLVKWAISQSKK